MTNYLYINHWSEWQSYRKDRGTPPWIKVHRKLMTNPKWAGLSDAEKGQIVSIWIIAADNDGKVTSDINALRKICQLDNVPDINKFIDLGLLTLDCPDSDANLTPTCQPVDAPEPDQNRPEKKELLKDLTLSDSQYAETKILQDAESTETDFFEKNKIRSGWNIETLLSPRELEAMKENTRLMEWDWVFILQRYHHHHKVPPDYPDKAFRAWFMKFTKGKPPN